MAVFQRQKAVQPRSRARRPQRHRADFERPTSPLAILEPRIVRVIGTLDASRVLSASVLIALVGTQRDATPRKAGASRAQSWMVAATPYSVTPYPPACNDLQRIEVGKFRASREGRGKSGIFIS